MGCGCGDRYVGDGMRTNAAMCLTCPGFRRTVKADWSVSAVCSIDGKPFLPAGLRAGPCPLGRHVDAEGLVTWRGVRWRGTPDPLRRRLRRLGVELKRGPLPGCGCVHRLKAWTEGVAERVRGVWVAAAACVIQTAPGGADGADD